jgi:hypothetical protein
MKKLIVNPDGTAILIEYEEKNNDEKLLNELIAYLNADCNDFTNNKNEGEINERIKR